MILQFDVINQRIVRKDDNYIVANSQFYLQMDFNFTQDWYGFGKTITFVSGTKKFSIGLNAQDSCVVPYEVIKTPSFLFSIRGELDDVIITTNVITVPIKASGETNGIAPGEPPKEIFSGLQNGLKGQVLGKSSDDNYDYDFQNLKDLQYDDENTLGEILEELVVDAVTDVKFENGYLKKVENNETTTIVHLYTKEEIDDLLENLDQYIEKSDTPGLIKNDGTIDTTQYASQSDLDSAKSDLQGDIDDLGTELRQSISNEENARIEAISNEVSARENADLTLQTNINNETTARQNAITSEETARQNADNQLQNAINNVARTYQNIEVDINDFQESIEYEDYFYEVIIVQDDYLINKNIKGMTLTFGLNESSSGNYASIFKVNELTGDIIIYAKEIPEENFIIPNIVIIF